MSEEELLAAVANVQNGDTESYSAVIGRVQQPIFRYCLYVLRDRQEAEDAAQEILIRGFRNIRRFRPTGSFAAWMYKIAYHHCVDLLKKRNRAARTLFRYGSDRRQICTNAGYEGEIYEILDLLAPEERQILLLRALEEYDYDEIAEILDLKPATVRKKYERVRKKIMREKGSNGHVESIKLN